MCCTGLLQNLTNGRHISVNEQHRRLTRMVIKHVSGNVFLMNFTHCWKSIVYFGIAKRQQQFLPISIFLSEIMFENVMSIVM